MRRSSRVTRDTAQNNQGYQGNSAECQGYQGYQGYSAECQGDDICSGMVPVYDAVSYDISSSVSVWCHVLLKNRLFFKNAMIFRGLFSTVYSGAFLEI